MKNTLVKVLRHCWQRTVPQSGGKHNKTEPKRAGFVAFLLSPVIEAGEVRVSLIGLLIVCATLCFIAWAVAAIWPVWLPTIINLRNWIKKLLPEKLKPPS